VPGKPAPKLIPTSAVERMQSGSVIVDIAAERGGNCELTVPGKTIVHNGVTIIGHTNIPATVPYHASAMYANNLVKLVALMVDKEGKFTLSTGDDVIAGCLACNQGLVVHPRIQEALGIAPAPAAIPAVAVNGQSKQEPALAAGGAR
jgi:H+-translocating NAD(P) transhydrogenase subunit alpha